MFRKLVTLALLSSLTVSGLWAQDRDFRAEKAKLAREERAAKRERRSDYFEKKPNIDYGTNILRVSPFTAMDVGVGFGLSYEKILGTDKMVGIELPVYLLLDANQNFNGINSGYPYYNDGGNNNAYFYFNPGLKIYPFGQRRVTYAVGPNLMFGAGGGDEWRYNSTYGTDEQVNVTKLRIGIMVNNYINFQFTRSFNLGLQAGIGVRYIDRETTKSLVDNTELTYNRGINVTGQFSVTMGYRF